MKFTDRMWGRRVGILGLGRIGIEIARRFEAFKMTIAYHTRGRKDVPYTHYPSLPGVARDVDIMEERRVRGMGHVFPAGISAEHTSDLQSLIRDEFAIFLLKETICVHP